MKKLEALLPLGNAQQVIEQLSTLEIDNLITTHVTVFDKAHTRRMTYRGFAYDDCSSARVKVEVNVSDTDSERAESLLTDCVAQ
jgi:nitrogen regulatory protein PII